jgi:hypothetical protein
MSEVDSFKFGAIVIDGSKHKRDVLLFPDGAVRERKRGFWRLGSHSIKKSEVDELIGANPDTVIIGKGIYSRAKLTSDAELALQGAKVELIVLPSKEAVQRLNELVRKGRQVASLIHITC